MRETDGLQLGYYYFQSGYYTLSNGLLSTSFSRTGGYGAFDQWGGQHIVLGEISLSGVGPPYLAPDVPTYYRLHEGALSCQSMRVRNSFFIQTGGTNNV